MLKKALGNIPIQELPQEIHTDNSAPIDDFLGKFIRQVTFVIQSARKFEWLAITGIGRWCRSI